VLSSAQEFPEHLDWSRTRYSDYETITAAELSKLAKEYLDPAKADEFIVLPVSAKSAATTAAGAPKS
jgi:zinc protease